MQGVQLILHAGDVGNQEVLDRLSRLTPVIAVRGNVDHGAWAQRLPETACLIIRQITICVLHDLNQLAYAPAQNGLQLVISGHSHRPDLRQQDNVLYLNPGSAGPRRFRQPVSLARLECSTDSCSVAVADLSGGTALLTATLTSA